MAGFLAGMMALGASGIASAAGELDLTFGNGGKVQSDFGVSSRVSGSSPVVQGDGKVLTGIAAGPSATSDMGVARWNTDGTADQTFGNGGFVLTDFGGRELTPNICIQADGKIVVGGNSSNAGFTSYHFIFARYLSDGSLDPSFGPDGNGKVTISDAQVGGATWSIMRDVNCLPDGRIVAVGNTNPPPARESNSTVVMLTSGGTLDPTFDGDGVGVYNAGVETGDVAWGIAILPDGKFVVGGHTSLPGKLEWRAYLFRLNPDGALDPSFGRVILDVPPAPGRTESSFSMGSGGIALQSDGKIVVVGARRTELRATPFDDDYLLLRLNQDGTLDSSFGDEGFVIGDLFPGYRESSFFGGVVLQEDGAIVAAGTHGPDYFAQPAEADFVVARFLSDGMLDVSFGTGGYTRTDFTGLRDAAWGVTLQADGRIVAAGGEGPASNPKKASIARYETRPFVKVDGMEITEEPGPAVARVTLSEAYYLTATVDYTTVDGTAKAGSDYTATSGTLTFAPGEMVKTISIPVLADTLFEGNETFQIKLSNPFAARFALPQDAEAMVTIKDNDSLPPPPPPPAPAPVLEQPVSAPAPVIPAPVIEDPVSEDDGSSGVVTTNSTEDSGEVVATGAASVPVTVINYVTGEVVGTCVTDADGNFSCAIDSLLSTDPDDSSKVTVTIQSAYGSQNLEKYFESALTSPGTAALETGVKELDAGDVDVHTTKAVEWLKEYNPERPGCFTEFSTDLFRDAGEVDDSFGIFAATAIAGDEGTCRNVAKDEKIRESWVNMARAMGEPPADEEESARLGEKIRMFMNGATDSMDLRRARVAMRAINAIEESENEGDEEAGQDAAMFQAVRDVVEAADLEGIDNDEELQDLGQKIGNLVSDPAIRERPANNRGEVRDQILNDLARHQEMGR